MQGPCHTLLANVCLDIQGNSYWLHTGVPLDVYIKGGTGIYRVTQLLTLHGVVARQCV